MGRLWVMVAYAATAACAATALGCSQDPPAQRQATPEPMPAKAPTRPLVDVTPVWPAPDRVDLAARAKLSPKSLAVLERAPVPVLVVRRDALLTKTVLLAKQRWLATTVTDDGITVTLHASKSAHRYPSIRPAEGDERVRDLPASVTKNEAIWSASWIEGGVAYALELECHALPDPRCDDAAYLMALTRDLTYVGGVGDGVSR